MDIKKQTKRGDTVDTALGTNYFGPSPNIKY